MQRIDFNEINQRISNLDLANLKRSDLGVENNFENVNDLFERNRKIIKDLINHRRWSREFSEHSQEKIYNTIQSFILVVDKIFAFEQNSNETSSRFRERRNDLIEELKTIDRLISQNILPTLNYLIVVDSETRKEDSLKRFENLETDFRKRAEDAIKSISENANKQKVGFDKTIKDANRKLLEVESFSVDKVVEKYGPIFDNQAKRNRKFAFISLALFIFFCLLTFHFVSTYFIPLLDDIKHENESTRIVKHYADGSWIEKSDFKEGKNSSDDWIYITCSMTTRLILLSILFILIKESLKNYNVNMHLYNLNKHRQNSLESFNTFTNSLNDDSKSIEVRNVLIKEISKTIYSNNKIGYLSEDKKTIDTNQIIEIFKAIKR